VHKIISLIHIGILYSTLSRAWHVLLYPKSHYSQSHKWKKMKKYNFWKTAYAEEFYIIFQYHTKSLNQRQF
jgi:hypothetical protein